LKSEDTELRSISEFPSIQILDGVQEVWDWEIRWNDSKQEVLEEALERLLEASIQGSTELLQSRLDSMVPLQSACIRLIATCRAKEEGQEGEGEAIASEMEEFFRKLFISLEEQIRSMMPQAYPGSGKSKRAHKISEKAYLLANHLCHLGRLLLAVKATQGLGREIMWKFVFLDGDSGPRHQPQLIKGLLVAAIQRTWGGHEMDYFVHHILRQANSRKEEKINVWTALSFMSMFFRHPTVTPMQAEDGMHGVTLQGEGGRKGRKRAFPGSGTLRSAAETINGPRYTTPCSISTDEIFSLLSHMRDCLRNSLLSQNLMQNPESPMETNLLRLGVSLIFYLVNRSTTLRSSIADALAAVSFSAHSHGGVTQYTGANEYILFRIYMAFPDLMLASCRNRKIDEQTLSIFLARGQAAAARSKQVLECPYDQSILQVHDTIPLFFSIVV